jgi:iron(III) transport system substrate-binding protein
MNIRSRYLYAVHTFVLSFLILGAVSASGIAQELVIYSGRSKGLVEPVIKQFEKEFGVRVRVRYGNTPQLAIALLEEGNRSPADLFWAQDGGALGVLAKRGMFTVLPESLLADLPERFKNSAGYWVATSGRARVLAYSTTRIDSGSVPATIYELADPRWRNRIGWAPQNASFQSFVSAMINRDGLDKTKAWLHAIRNNGAKTYRSNVPIIQAIAAGEIDLGLTNHYYLIRFKKADDHFPVAQTFFYPGDVGNFINVAGAGILKTSGNKDLAITFIRFLLSEKGQQFFTSEIFEYPVKDNIIPSPELLPLEELLSIIPDVDVESLDNLDETLKLLREVGLL